jgi:hypothetical protein
VNRPIEDEETGFCSGCADNYAVESYWEKDRPAVEARRNDWKARTSSAPAMRERQHKSRLLRDTRPHQPASPFADPLEIAGEALDRFHRIRLAVKSNVLARAALDEVEEALRVLSWGPEDQSSRTAP